MDDLERLSRAATELSERETRHLARIEHLEAALRALTAAEPVAAGDLTYYCVFCEGVSRRPSDTRVVHKEDCPWVAARALPGEAE